MNATLAILSKKQNSSFFFYSTTRPKMPHSGIRKVYTFYQSPITKTNIDAYVSMTEIRTQTNICKVCHPT